MRTITAFSYSLLIFGLSQQIHARTCTADAKDLDLQAIMTLMDTGEVTDADTLQNKINEDNGINNVDTTKSGTVDYIAVKQRRSGGNVYFDFFAVPQSAQDVSDPCRIAHIQISKDVSSDNSRVVIVGTYPSYVVGCDDCPYTYYYPWDFSTDASLWVGPGLFFGWSFFGGPGLWWGWNYRPWIGGGYWGWRGRRPYGALVSYRLGTYGRWGWSNRSVYTRARSASVKVGGGVRGGIGSGGRIGGSSRGVSKGSVGGTGGHVGSGSNHAFEGGGGSHVGGGSHIGSGGGGHFGGGSGGGGHFGGGGGGGGHFGGGGHGR